jgi:hypothetical protein
MGGKAAIPPIKANECLLFPHRLFQGPTLVDNMGNKADSGEARWVGIDKRARWATVTCASLAGIAAR